jgi:hypothetical protein
MSVLELGGRPFVVLNPSNKAHRAYYHQFVKTDSWGHCPVRFVVPDGYGDLVSMIRVVLIDYYVNKEFGNVVKVPQPLVRQKKKKTVDN